MDTPLRTFLGREIGPAIVEAVEALNNAPTREIVEFSAGENMPIMVTMARQDDTPFDPFLRFAWNGERWVEVD